ncbi:hypothetical protein [Acetobacter fallax]|uniref:hypothetical protein n=1 Tax=Acetobacter fallax TaxID=1737473 RepID=UPI00156A934B|nr:hypothetical protein [Acetobacter fallax]NHO36504.1 hypothetical protein [Acetobacter fallax]
MSENNFEVRRFGTLWYGGRLSAVECACAHSLVRQGVPLTLFSYNAIDNIPDGIEIRDAEKIVPRHMTSRFILNGSPHPGHFSDYFRYNMILRTDMTWIDLDMVALKKIQGNWKNNIVVKEEGGGINGAILYISSKNILEYLISETTLLMDKNLRWGETGPLLLDKMIRKFHEDIELSEASSFYPIDHTDIYKIFLPEFLEWCHRKTSHAETIHLFNNILTKIGLWKEIAPPRGSFFAEIIEQTGGMKFFRDQYPEDVMKNMIRNYCMRLSGADLGIKNITRQALPGLLRTYRHYRPRP